MEKYKPIKHIRPDTFIGKIMFFCRFVLDFQAYTVYRDLKKNSDKFKGNVLDVGCGAGPYKDFIRRNGGNYFGMDIPGARDFDYSNKGAIMFDGQAVPSPDERFDCVLCTEVLEHIVNPQRLIAEFLRVLKPRGSAIITVPWSARFHYQPFDYHRYTPSMLKILFKEFSSVEVFPRGTDITVIVSKLLIKCVMPVSSALAKKPAAKAVSLPVVFLSMVLVTPIVLFLAIVGHLSVLFNWGTDDDPLGYTLVLKKHPR